MLQYIEVFEVFTCKCLFIFFFAEFNHGVISTIVHIGLMFNSLGLQGNLQVLHKAMKICLFHANTLLSGLPQHLSAANIS